MVPRKPVRPPAVHLWCAPPPPPSYSPHWDYRNVECYSIVKAWATLSSWAGIYTPPHTHTHTRPPAAPLTLSANMSMARIFDALRPSGGSVRRVSDMSASSAAHHWPCLRRGGAEQGPGQGQRDAM